MTTDIRAEAAAAAEKWFDTKSTVTQLAGFEAGYLSGHAAGVADGARAFAEFIETEGRYGAAPQIHLRCQLARFLASAPGTGLAQGKDEEGA